MIISYEKLSHDDVIKWKHIPRNWPFVRGNSPVPVNSPHKGQWRGALMFSLICVWINGWVNNREAGDLRRHRGHYDVNVMCTERLQFKEPVGVFSACRINKVEMKWFLYYITNNTSENWLLEDYMLRLCEIWCYFIDEMWSKCSIT